MVSVVLVSVAVIPALYLILQVRKYDRLEKEPVGLIVSIVILGMLSTFIAMFLELVLEFLLAYFVSYYSPLYNIILYFLTFCRFPLIVHDYILMSIKIED